MKLIYVPSNAMRIEVLPDPLVKMEYWTFDNTDWGKESLRWTDNKIDAVPFESKVALNTQFEGSGWRRLSSIVGLIEPSKDGIIETNTIINIMLHVAQCPNLLFRERV